MNELNQQSDKQLVATLAATIFGSVAYLLGGAIQNVKCTEVVEGVDIVTNASVEIAKRIIAKANDK